MRRYGVDSMLLNTHISAAAKQSLLELQLLRVRLIEFVTQKTMGAFSAARQRTLREIEVRQRKLLRRTARALRAIPEAQRYRISEFVYEDAQDILKIYRLLISEAALSTHITQVYSLRFISQWGYKVN
jgi:hypothetical protein